MAELTDSQDDGQLIDCYGEVVPQRIAIVNTPSQRGCFSSYIYVASALPRAPSRERCRASADWRDPNILPRFSNLVYLRGHGSPECPGTWWTPSSLVCLIITPREITRTDDRQVVDKLVRIRNTGLRFGISEYKAPTRSPVTVIGHSVWRTHLHCVSLLIPKKHQSTRCTSKQKASLTILIVCPT